MNVSGNCLSNVFIEWSVVGKFVGKNKKAPEGA